VRDAIQRVRADPSVRVLLLTGAGRGFCAGQDLGDRAVAPGAEPVDLGASIDRNYKRLVLALRGLPLPVVCAVNGVAAGAGANIALACDIVIAAKSASFVQAFSKIGLDSRLRRDLSAAATRRNRASDGSRASLATSSRPSRQRAGD
jgi:2-(1,2-epoxy-1,2-dihydrophenyl)acetyl-CoA isomerase